MFNPKEKVLLGKIINERIQQNWALTESTYLSGSKKYDKIIDENNDLKLFSEKYSISLVKDIQNHF